MLVLTNRIDWLNQFRDDLVHGKTGENPKLPIISETIRNNLRIKTFHSKWDNLSDLDERFFTTDESDAEEIFSSQNARTKDTILFSTFQTAIARDLPYRLPHIDLIIIDEAHNVKPEDGYQALIADLAELSRANGRTPMVLAVTATPTNITKELFGEPIFTFGLAEYIASPYSPAIDYHLVSATNAPKEIIESIIAQVESAKKIKDSLSKKALIREIEQSFETIISSYPTLDELVRDLLEERIGMDPSSVGQTIVFVNSQNEADEVASIINRQYGQ